MVTQPLGVNKSMVLQLFSSSEAKTDPFSLLREFNRDHGSACLIVTHDPRLAARCDRIIEWVDGRLAAGCYLFSSCLRTSCLR